VYQPMLPFTFCASCTAYPGSSVAAAAAAAELPAGSAGTSNGGASVFLSAVHVSSLTGIRPCPDSHYCPGGSPVGAGVPQACPAGITVQSPPGTSRSACNRECSRVAMCAIQRHHVDLAHSRVGVLSLWCASSLPC
jgi:hypothetical protein